MRKILSKKPPESGGFFERRKLFLEFFCFLLASVEFINAGSFEEPFFPGIEGMAFQTGFDFEFLSLDGTEGLEAVSARTDNLYRMRFWVDILFHRKKICRFRLIRVSRSKGLSNGQHQINGGVSVQRELLADFSALRSPWHCHDSL